MPLLAFVRAQALTLLVGLIAIAAVSSSWVGHVDVGDADVYRVIARNMVQDHAWTQLRYLPGAHTQFFEHLPFGFWPLALALSWFGEWGLNGISAVFSLATVLVVYTGIRRCGGSVEAALLGALVLILTPDFYARAGHPYLDQSLMLFASAAVLPLLPGSSPGWRGWLIALLCLIVAALIKGPFGLVPFAGVIAARAVLERSARTAILGGLVMAAAALPTVLFVVLQPGWLEGFGRNQVLASASGGRTDGQLNTLYPVLALLGHFWPGMALLVPAAWVARRSPGTAPVLGLASVFALGALCLPARKVWNHSLVIYPLLAIFIGVALSPALHAHFTTRVRGWAVRILSGLAVFAILFAALGGGRTSLPGECVMNSHFAAEASGFQRGETVLIADETVQWSLLSSLASHYAVVPIRVPPKNRQALLQAYPAARWLLSMEPCPPSGRWELMKEEGGWRLCHRPGPELDRAPTELPGADEVVEG